MTKKEKSILPERVEVLCDDPKIKLIIEKAIANKLEHLAKDKNNES
jgi:hypothetical protein